MVDCLGRGALLLEIENVEHFPTFFTQFVDLAGKLRGATKLSCIMGKSKVLPFYRGSGLGGSRGIGRVLLGPGREEDKPGSN